MAASSVVVSSRAHTAIADAGISTQAGSSACFCWTVAVKVTISFMIFARVCRAASSRSLGLDSTESQTVPKTDPAPTNAISAEIAGSQRSTDAHKRQKLAPKAGVLPALGKMLRREPVDS